MRASNVRRVGLGLALAAAPSAAFAQTPGVWDWFNDLFKFHPYLGALDYIFIVVALLAAPVAWFAYYRHRLPTAVLEMQRPDQVKWVAFGVSLSVFALLLMLAPGLPTGVLLLLLLVGAVLAWRLGLSILIGAALLIVAIILISAKAAHLLPH